MARRSTAAAADPFADLASKLEILEREMAVQREALERLKEMGREVHADHHASGVLPVRKPA